MNQKKLLGVLIFILTLTSLAPSLTYATEKKFKLSKSVVKFDVPDDWQTVQDFLGLPLAVLGPEEKENDHRPIISVLDSGVKANLDPSVLTKEQGDFEIGRREWLNEIGGKPLKFFPYTQLKFKNVKDVHQIGYEYELGEEEYSEFTYYLTCEENLFMVKTIILKNKMEKHNKKMNEILDSFDCK